jgi:PD-(D/E)XK endonuclease
MSKKQPHIPHAKKRGEWAELRFLLRAIEHGLALTKPCGESSAYDFAVDCHGHFLRVQVKCTQYKRDNSYQCDIASNRIPYDPSQLDFFAAYVIPADAWYILPIRATNRQPDILLTPHRPSSKYGKYQEAWHLLEG